MNLRELSAPETAALPVADLAAHLRLGSGFADDGAEDAALAFCLRAAMAAIEGRIGKALLERDCEWEVAHWFSEERQGLPVGPVSAVSELALVDRAGGVEVVEPGRYRLHRDIYRPELRGDPLPRIPLGGRARLRFLAGFGPHWSDLPADLAQAVMLLAAENHEARAAGYGAPATMSFGVLALIERYRTVRLLGDLL
ncbi:hypothetical protein HMH01_15825 [Halovulum dunhuangense]|uniref:PhiE125 gp8 family phage protein n=1 Tax=Halovulum dunhuangense TaxID=1505036 RepID=A0A849L697_9RHOB|nr:hypothetical protein [Halovulum dunhuangense]NNU81906.1 hypothetical protein [Halovulum dunhuangense]